MTTSRVALTQPGYNAFTETDKRHFIFDSNFNTFKIIKTGIMTFNVSNLDEHIESVEHGLSFPTGCYGFLKHNGLSVVIPTGVRYYTAVGDTDQYVWFKEIKINDTEVIAVVYNQTGATVSVSVRYYLFEVPL